nr:IS5 family transposase [Salinibacter altiplanensis]
MGLWEAIQPPLPPEPPKPKGGRSHVPHRAALTGILFVLRNSIPWELLSQEMGYGMTCWRRLRDWQKVGVWERLRQVLLDQLSRAGQIDWSRASVHSQSISAIGVGKEGSTTGPDPVDRGKPGTKRHLVVDRRGTPRARHLTGANALGPAFFENLIDGIRPIRRPRGRPRKRPAKLRANKAYDIPQCRVALTKRRIKVRIARKGVGSSRNGSSKKLGRHRWVVERTLAWLWRYRRLRVRYEKRKDIHEALPQIGCALIT